MNLTSSSVPSFLPNGSTKFCLLFGRDLLHSPSPTLQTLWFQTHNFNCVYLPCPLPSEESFKGLLQNMLGTPAFLGANITLPYKQTVLELGFLKSSEQVKTIGAANTIYQNHTKEWCLENTDVKGIDQSIKHLLSQKENFSIVLLGGGGAAAAAFHCGLQNPFCLNISCFTRDPEKTYVKFPTLKCKKNIFIYPLSEESLKNYSVKIPVQNHKILIINTIPLGRKGEIENIHALTFLKLFSPQQICYFDMIAGETDALNFAKENGIAHLDGNLMLTTQAQESFFLWTGIRIK